MFSVSRKARFAVQSILNIAVVSVFALWVSEADAMSSGGGSGGAGGSAGGSGGSAGGQGGQGGGGGGRDAPSGQERGGEVTRNASDDLNVPLGFVVSDDVCTGGKFEKC